MPNKSRVIAVSGISILFAGLVTGVYLSILPLGAYAAELSLQTNQTNVRKGDTLSVNIVLSGGENTLGTDAILLYDTQKLEPIAVKESALYPSYQPVSARRINSRDGKISLSGSANLNQPVKADGIFGVVVFRTLKVGDTALSFDYAPAATNKTGVISFFGSNLLTRPPAELSISVENNNFFLSFFSKIISNFQNIFITGKK